MTQKLGEERPAPTYKREFITAQIANDMLAHNTENRSFADHHEDQLVDYMASGLWKENGATIVFDERGVLVDGQHRLHAIVKTGIGRWMGVCRGVERDAFTTIDINRRRSAADALTIIGHKNASTIAAAVGLLERMRLGQSIMSARKPLGAPKVAAALARYPGLLHSIDLVGTPQRGINRTVMATAHYLFSQISPEQANEFCFAVISGAGLQADDPRLSLREQMLWKTTGGRVLRGSLALALTIKAWNAWRQGRGPLGVRMRLRGEHPETTFPVPV